MALRILRSGRADIIAAVEAGNMSLNKALKIIDSKPSPTRLDKLVSAWRAAPRMNNGYS
jgi:hypothetical protein